MPERCESETVDAPMRESKMTVEMVHLAEATNQLMRYAEQLEVRLQGVLQPQPKSANSDTPIEALPDRLSEIRSCCKRVNAANYMLKSILSRLEV